MRKRLAQRACPELAILPHDEGRDSREFEAVAAAAEEVVSGVEISRPGLLMIPADGAARFHGSEEALAEALVTAVAEYAGFEASVGAADGLLAAIVAARGSVLLESGASQEFLAREPIGTLVLAAMERHQREAIEDLVGVLSRLGLHTIADFTALPARDVLARFGAPGLWAYRLARGQDVRPPVLRRSEEDIQVVHTMEEPAQTVEQLAFIAGHSAAQLAEELLQAGVRCGRVRIGATTERGDSLERVWRTDVGVRAGAFCAHMTDRVRWQLEGWLSGTSTGPEPSPLTSLTLTAQDVVPLGAEQSYLWGGVSGADARARRTVERLQGLLGAESVLAVSEQGGRHPRDRVLAVPWGQEPPSHRRVEHPWPGAIPDPQPATVLPVPEPVQVLDAGGSAVVITRRLAVSAPPTYVRRKADPQDKVTAAMNRHPASGGGTSLQRHPEIARGEVAAVWSRPQPIEAWAGPWPVAERWWSEEASRKVFVQVTLRDAGAVAGGQALLLSYAAGQWSVEGIYD
jgi:protein ImuB